MNKNLLSTCLLFGVIGLFLFMPELSFAQGFGGSGFETKMTGLTNKLINVVMPAVAILGLVYAAFLAATGDPSAKPRMIGVVIACIVCFMAPVIIRWLQSATSTGGGFGP